MVQAQARLALVFIHVDRGVVSFFDFAANCKLSLSYCLSLFTELGM